MTRPRGESHHNASITLKKASNIKRRITAGAPVSKVAERYDLPYQVVYRIAKGQTWPEAEPKGIPEGV